MAFASLARTLCCAVTEIALAGRRDVAVRLRIVVIHIFSSKLYIMKAVVAVKRVLDYAARVRVKSDQVRSVTIDAVM